MPDHVELAPGETAFMNTQLWSWAYTLFAGPFVLAGFAGAVYIAVDDPTPDGLLGALLVLGANVLLAGLVWPCLSDLIDRQPAVIVGPEGVRNMRMPLLPWDEVTALDIINNDSRDAPWTVIHIGPAFSRIAGSFAFSSKLRNVIDPSHIIDTRGLAEALATHAPPALLARSRMDRSPHDADLAPLHRAIRKARESHGEGKGG